MHAPVANAIFPQILSPVFCRVPPVCLPYTSGVEYLRERHLDGSTVVSNIFVKEKQAEGPLPRSGTASIFTQQVRPGDCGELDVVVISPMAAVSALEPATDVRPASTPAITEVWEAKFTVSPVTIHDAITKKLSAISRIMADETHKLVYGDGLVAFFPSRQQLDGERFGFGIFGLELMTPNQAAVELQGITCRQALIRDPQRIMHALETGVVMFEAAWDVADRVSELRLQLREKSANFHIMLRIGTSICDA